MQAMDIRTIMRLNTLIAQGKTGAPAELASTLGRTERSVYSYIRYMREELDAPIANNNSQSTYCCTCKEGRLHFKWQKNKNNNTDNRTQKPKQE
jgi:hypothetical protein